MIVVGGGVIGTEYACMMAAVGVRVTLIESRPRLLEFIDDELAESLQFRMRDMGIRLRLGESVAHIDAVGDGAQATLGSNKVVHADALLYCIGRQGATDRLNLPAAGLTADGRGRLKVNEYYQTEAPHIYAAGDVIGFPALAATSMEQGRLASCHMFRQIAEPRSRCSPMASTRSPRSAWSGPRAGADRGGHALRGWNRPLSRDRAGPADRRPLRAAQGVVPSQEPARPGHSRHRDGHTELIHIGQAVMAAGMAVDYFVESVFNYPTLAECYKIAALDGINRIRPVSEPAKVVDGLAKEAVETKAA